MGSNEKDLKRLLDIREIESIAFVYALGMDTLDAELAASAFTEDGVWDATAAGVGRFEGHDKMIEFLTRQMADSANQYHATTNCIVTFDGENSAHGTNYVDARGNTKTGAAYGALVLNRDQYLRTDEGWRIASRIMTPLGPANVENMTK